MVFLRKGKSTIIQSATGENVLSPSKKLGDAVVAGGESSANVNGALLDYIGETDRKFNHQEREIRMLKIKKTVQELDELAKTGKGFAELSLTMKFFKHMYEFVVAEGLAPEKIKKYVGTFKRAAIALGLVGLASIGSSVYSYLALKRTLEENRGLVNMVQDTEKNTAAIRDLYNMTSNIYESVKTEKQAREKDVSVLKIGFTNLSSRVDLQKSQINSINYGIENLWGEISQLSEDAESRDVDKQSQINALNNTLRGFYFDYTNLVAQNSRYIAGIEKNVQYLTERVFNAEKNYSKGNEQLIKKLDEFSSKYQKLEGRLNKIDK